MITTATINSSTFSIASKTTGPTGIIMSADGKTLWTSETSIGDNIDEYRLSIPFEISSAKWRRSISLTGSSINPSGLFFKPDGTKMYTIDYTDNMVDEWNLSSPWDIMTAVYLQSFDVTAKEASPIGLFFKEDGLKMYVTGQASLGIHEYNLGTAWNVTTAVFFQSKDLAVFGADAQPCLFFKPDGTKLYINGSVSDLIIELSLTAWDISTLGLVQTISTTSLDITPKAVCLKSDGLKMYMVGTATDTIFEYDLSTAWNISTAVIKRDGGLIFN